MGCGVFLLAIEHDGKIKGQPRIPPIWRNARPSRISNYKRNRRLTTGSFHKLGNLGDDLVDRHILALARGTVLELDGAVLKTTLAEHYLIREAHKVVVGKLKARTLIAIVDDDLDTLGAQTINNLLADASALLLLGIERNHRDLVRSNGDRPDNTVLVVCCSTTAASERDTPTP